LGIFGAARCKIDCLILVGLARQISGKAVPQTT
jgi:hypothetical protein